MNNSTPKTGTDFGKFFTAIAIVLCLGVAILIFAFVFGDPSNFEGGDPEKGHPHNFFGTVYKGGYVVPVIISLLLMTFTFFFERLFTVLRAKGKGDTAQFVVKIKSLLAKNKIDEAMVLCNQKKGSVGNVVYTGLMRYKEVVADATMDKEEKLAAIQTELEEATTLELPALQKNLVVISTIASVATLMGLFGTVLGMIKAFSALATAGAPDASALSTGISEALINTALGIGTSALAIIFYNLFTTLIDGITFRIEEVGFTIAQSFKTNYHETPAVAHTA